VSGKLCKRHDILGFLGVGVERESFRHLPYEDLAIVGAGSDDAVVERVPVCVEDAGRVASEQWYLVGNLAALVEWDDGKCTAAAGLPIDGDVFGVDLGWEHVSASICHKASSLSLYLYKVGVPGISTDVEVVVAELFPCWFSKDVS
jgi:hypothetical protein